MTLDADFAFPAPEGLDAEQAAMAEPVSVGVWACRKAGVVAGDRVLVTGAGPIGLLAGQVARAFGATQVTITDVSDFRLGVATELGLDAHRADQPLTERVRRPARVLRRPGRGQDRASPPWPAPAARSSSGWARTRCRSTCRSCRAASSPSPGRSATPGPTRSPCSSSPPARWTCDRLITHHFGLEETEAALTAGRREPESIKSIVLPQR